eukprot:NODE_7907_length_1540_cov_3.021231.p1 GENE.NODE_7907_length_1540_cov_3.021231~~NODE_7907_length_1540_cov_3.021231.p1  ORF type:complete len:248 (-),score=67.13 NODE_7907_length_1540_cov_3.021231:330-1073(-)
MPPPESLMAGVISPVLPIVGGASASAATGVSAAMPMRSAPGAPCLRSPATPQKQPVLPTAMQTPCSYKCCWRWLARALLLELSMSRKAMDKARKAFVEQEHVLVKLTALQAVESVNRELVEMVGRRRREHATMLVEVADLKNECEAMRAHIKLKWSEQMMCMAEVSKLSSTLHRLYLQMMSVDMKRNEYAAEYAALLEQRGDVKEEFLELSKKAERQKVSLNGQHGSLATLVRQTKEAKEREKEKDV